jgi:hypothetical protein
VFCKVIDLDITTAADLIPGNESAPVQFLKQGFDFCGVIRQNFGLDSFWTIFQSPLTVGDCPQANKEKPPQWLNLCKNVIAEKTGFYSAHSCHREKPPRQTSAHPASCEALTDCVIRGAITRKEAVPRQELNLTSYLASG